MAWPLILFVLTCVSYTNAVLYCQPEQVHLAYGSTPQQMMVTWVTMSSTGVSLVEYGLDNLDLVAKGREDVFVDGGSQARKLYMHRVLLDGLQPGKRYTYHVGSSCSWSALFFFTAMQAGPSWSPRFAVFGDMGNINAQSLGRLQEETQKGHFDAILHVGDFAYNMDDDNALVGDAFMQQVESVAAYVPYMTTVGNHEAAYNFSNYKSRFSMPGGDGENMFYSFNVGPAHIVGFSSEYYYYMKYGFEQVVTQYNWLIKDLEEANTAENRAARPWLITMCHRPLYCSNSDDAEHCTNQNNMIREGIPTGHSYEFGIEKLLYKYGVDLHFQAHEHSYERMFPVYNSTVCKGSESAPYKNPRAPVHMVTGSAGCQERTDPFLPAPHPYSVYQSDDYGYTRMTIHNNTHLYMEQVSDDKGGVVIDSVMIEKDQHGMDIYDCHLQDSRLKWRPWRQPGKA